MVSGRKPNEERRRQVAEARGRGLSLREIGERLGIAWQTVQRIVQALERSQNRSVPCSRCGTAIFSAGALPRDAHNALCLTCLARPPEVSFGQRLKAYRLAAGLTRAELGRRVGLRSGTISSYEEDRRRPRGKMITRLVEVLGPGLVETGPGVQEEMSPPGRQERPLTLPPTGPTGPPGDKENLSPEVAQAREWLRLVELEACRDNILIILRRPGQQGISPQDEDCWIQVQKEFETAKAAYLAQGLAVPSLPSPLENRDHFRAWCQTLRDHCDILLRSGQTTVRGENLRWKVWRLLGELTGNPVFAPTPPENIQEALSFLQRPLDLSSFQRQLQSILEAWSNL
ncbi:MAG: helix-turn-helix domain-containing protein [Planctomycetes bacterium]|nr:helix-turn-helix domain-containing protein [Planctomycetota bacterium]